MENYSPIRIFGRYVELILHNDSLWEQFRMYVRQIEPAREPDFFAYHRELACADIWRGMLENMGGGWPITLFAAAGFLLLRYRDYGHDLDAELFELTGRSYRFADPEKAVLISNALRYGPAPSPGEVIEQRLTVSRSGRLWLSEYAYGDGVTHRRVHTLQKSVGEDRAAEVLDLLGGIFAEQNHIEMVTDVGTWDLSLWNDADEKADWHGPLISSFRYDGMDASKCIRQFLGLDSLFLFDGGRG